MPSNGDIQWFKAQFAPELAAATAGTPFDSDMLTAIACQETGYIWGPLRQKGMPVAKILELCVGDTIDGANGTGRSAFPIDRAQLLQHPRGSSMFDIGRKALEALAVHVPGYTKVATNKKKFCRGYGIFQYDLQFFKIDPDYFLLGKYKSFAASAQKCVQELFSAMKRMGWQGRQTLSDYEKACVAIAYNAGSFRPNRGLKQGHFNGTEYYGEAFFGFLRRAQSIGVTGGPASLPPSVPGRAVIAPPTPVTPTGKLYRVDTREDDLRLRSEPKIDPANPRKNVKAKLPDGQLVRAVSNQAANGFIEVETTLFGAHYRGFVAKSFLTPEPEAVVIAPVVPAVTPPTSGIVAAHLPRRSDSATRRREKAGAHSLNEAGQPGRKGTTPAELRQELTGIIDWLAVDEPSHLRYQRRPGLTFCNIYAHDYCTLAGVYLPRVWWTQGAIEALTKGENVAPKYEQTVIEVRANALFRWLRDFGPRFGWRQTGTLTKLQEEVNLGAVGLIIARNRNEGVSGHVAMVVPETEALRAKRVGGEVIAPLQSQAGASNHRYTTGRANWWSAEQFADSAFWLHA